MSWSCHSNVDLVGEEFDDRGGKVWRPHADDPLGVAQKADCIVGVLPQHVAGTHLGSVLGYDLPCAGVLHAEAPLINAFVFDD